MTDFPLTRRVQKEETDLAPLLAAFRANFGKKSSLKTPFDDQPIRLEIHELNKRRDEPSRLPTLRQSMEEAGLEIFRTHYSDTSFGVRAPDFRTMYMTLPPILTVLAPERIWAEKPYVMKERTASACGGGGSYEKYTPHREFLFEHLTKDLQKPEEIDMSKIDPVKLFTDFGEVSWVIPYVPRDVFDNRLTFDVTPGDQAWPQLIDSLVRVWDIRRTGNQLDVSLFTLQKMLNRTSVNPLTVIDADSFCRATNIVTPTNGEMSKPNTATLHIPDTPANRESVAAMQRLVAYQRLAPALLS